ncbi:hypothetical protein WME98_40375 [Sorangium sp. So ce296]|uniref:hypothetical protein n=1 Tax=Sorangium sp. So ce296 TaxID=3133296 RepID=UPI003F5E96E5
MLSVDARRSRGFDRGAYCAPVCLDAILRLPGQLEHVGLEMATELIPSTHLEHLLESLYPFYSSDDMDLLFKKARSDSLASKLEVLDAIDRYKKGTSEHLSSIWCFRGSRSVLLWDLPFLRGATVEQALDYRVGGQHRLFDDWESNKVDGRRLKPGQWVTVKQSDRSKGKDRVYQVRMTKASFDARVRLVKPLGFTFEDQRQSTDRTTDVELHIDFSKKYRIAEVYAYQTDAQTALVTFIEWCTGQQMPTARTARSGYRRDHMTSIGFTERQIDSLAVRLSLENTSAKARPKHGQAGEVQLWGDFSGPRRQALDSSVLATHSIDKSPKSLLWYNMTHVHPDGYREHTELEFMFKAAHPRITFRQKASRLCMSHVVSELCHEIGVV